MANFRINMDLFRNLPAISQIYKSVLDEGRGIGQGIRHPDTGIGECFTGAVRSWTEMARVESMHCANPETDKMSALKNLLLLGYGHSVNGDAFFYIGYGHIVNEDAFLRAGN